MPSVHDITEDYVYKVEDYLNEVDYGNLMGYMPSDFAIDFVNFIKMVNGGESENKTPPVHYRMIDNFIADNDLDTINMCHRGIAKSTLKEFLILYIGVYGSLPKFGKVPYALYVSDSIDNGVKKMRKALEHRINNSPFLQQYLDVSKCKITDIRWELVNANGNSFVVSGHGAKTGVRGTRENGSRPVLALLDDLISDSDARSPTIIADVEDTVYNAIDHAMNPNKRKIIWSGTPFNAKDPLYKAVESGAWNVNVYPVCEKFPCKPEEFKGSWPDRFTYDYVNKIYIKAKKSGKLASFNQELMLQIMSDEQRVILDSDIQWYSRKVLMQQRQYFNFYITTDFATSEKQSADFSVISVWAVNSSGHFFWVDGICAKQGMDKNVKDLFRLAQMYKPISVGVEVSGQQGGFIPYIKEQMMHYNTYFALASENNSNREGIRPTTDKHRRFNVVQPYFKQYMMHFPVELREEPIMIEAMNEISLICADSFKSKHDDFIDTISMLGSMPISRPSEEGNEKLFTSADAYWEDDDDFGNDISGVSNYIV